MADIPLTAPTAIVTTGGDWLNKIPNRVTAIVDPTGLGGGVINAGIGAVKTTASVNDFLVKLAMRATWVRILQVTGGSALIIGGIVWLGRKQITGIAVGAATGGPVGAVLSTGAGKAIHNASKGK